jgi:hypothetical protein
MGETKLPGNESEDADSKTGGSESDGHALDTSSEILAGTQDSSVTVFAGASYASSSLQNSGCAKFVDHLMKAVDQAGASVTQRAIGANLALAARSDLAKKAAANKLDYTGFKESLIAGGQNGWAMVHIQGIAGSSLAGYTTAIDDQFREDKNQLKLGLDWKAMGRIAIPYAGRSDYPLDKYIAEKQAEIADDHAGVDVGGALSDKINDRSAYLVAKIKILNLLYDK